MTQVASRALIRALIEADEVALWRLGSEPPVDVEDPEGKRWHAYRNALQRHLAGYRRALEALP